MSIPVACIAWTITHEEIFREPRDYCQQQSKQASSLSRRKFFYLFTCEYCLSHYVSVLVLILTRFRFCMLTGGFFALVWVANQYMSTYNHLRLDIKYEQVEIKAHEIKVMEKQDVARENKAA
ncbi:MAG TPA: hypothetical protein VNX26_08915 [Candidatus Acidoferrum sp.]|nr:hypothetical protein [Candidatus Acidoferrum sp.]